MTVTEIVDICMNFVEDVSDLDSDTTPRRTRVVQWLNEVVAEVWQIRDWGFSYTRNNGVITNDGTIPFPADFMEIGQHGGIYLPARRGMLVETHIQDIQEAREIDGGLGNATRFAIFGGLIYTDSTVATDPFVLWYRFYPELRADADAEPIAIPAAHHNTVVINGIIAKSRRNKGASQMGEWEQKYKEGLARMVATERKFKSATQFLPMAVNNW